MAITEVALQECGNRVRRTAERDLTARRTRATLEAVAIHAGAAADGSLGHRAACGCVNRHRGVLRCDAWEVDAVEVPVPGLCHDG